MQETSETIVTQVDTESAPETATEINETTTETTENMLEVVEDQAGKSGKLPPVYVDEVNLQVKNRAWLMKKVVEQHARIDELETALAEQDSDGDQPALQEQLKDAQAECKLQKAQIESLEAMLDSSRETVKQLRGRLSEPAPVTAESAAKIADLELRLAEAQEQNAALRNTVKELSECEHRAAALEAERVRDLELIRDMVRSLMNQKEAD